MKRKGLIVALIALLILCAVLVVSHMLERQQNVDFVWRKLESGDITVMKDSAYADCKDTTQLQKKILSFADTANDPEQLAKMGVTLSQIGYENAAVKTALAEKIKQTLPQVKDSPQVYLETLAMVSDAGEGYYALHNILSEQALMTYLEENFTKAIIQKGAGGYYDGKKNKNDQYTNDLLYTITESHSYSGDFYLHNYVSKAYRPTGERWEDELMKDYDETSLKLYYQDNPLNCPMEFTSNFLDYSYGAEAAYVHEDCVAVIRCGKIYTTAGNILYNREVSAYEELAKHAAAICIPEAAYDDAGEAAMWYFTDNKALFPTLNAQEIAERMPGQWTFYYMHAGELSVDYKENGTYIEHYTNSDKTYPWGAEDDLLCCRKKKDGSWYYQYEMRQITDELYLLYEPDGSVRMAITKNG